MVSTFLENQKHAKTIAQVAIVFQCIVTVCIVSILIVAGDRPSDYYLFLKFLLFVDVAFVILHMSYRAAYTGPKVVLMKTEKRVLTAHIAFSLVAILVTGIMLGGIFNMSVLSIVIWTTSLILGVVFYIKKYR
jgi:hypothetical protein